VTTATIRGVSLVKTFFATFPSVGEGLAYINDQLGTSYQHNHKSRWERGERDPGRNARAVMLHRVLPDVLKSHGRATDADIEAALDKLL